MWEIFLIVLIPGLALGAIVGAIAQYTNFCSVGAVADVILAKDWRRARSWMLAAAVAMAGTQTVAALNLVLLDRSVYTLPQLAVLPAIIGGLAFGYGMAMAGGCLQRALVRVGGGSRKSLMAVAIMGVTMVLVSHVLTRTGVYSQFVFHMKGPSSIDAVTATALGLSPGIARAFVSGVCAAGLAIFCFKDGWFRQSPSHLWGGIGIGSAVVVAWLMWRWAGGEIRGLNLLVDLKDTVQWLTSSATAPVFAPLLGITVLVGIVLGAFLIALIRGDLMLDSIADVDDMNRHALGGLLMGAGGALTYGCTFGQGLSGIAALSIDAVLATAAMIAGCLWGIRALEAGSAWGGLRLCFARRAV